MSDDDGGDPRNIVDDARVKFTVGWFNLPRGLAFDHHRGLLFVTDSRNLRVKVYTCDDDGSFVFMLADRGSQPSKFMNPDSIAIDHEHGRILIAYTNQNRIQSWSLSDQSFLSCIGQYGSGDLEFNGPRGIAIDNHHRRVIIVDTNNHRLVFLSSIDLSFLFEVGNEGSQPGEFSFPHGIAIDHERHRIIVIDTNNNRVQVLSLADGSFLFQFGSQGNQPGQFDKPLGVCVDNQGRIILTDHNHRLQAFTHQGHHISSFHCGWERPLAVAFDEHRGLIAFSAGEQVHVIGANQWLADTFVWHVNQHRHAPSSIKQAISAMTMIRSLVDESALSMIPNELLFEIFSFL